MPYRHAGSALCVVCNAFTRGYHCPRCGSPLCDGHAPEHTELCPDCELEYEQLQAMTLSVPMSVLALRVGLVSLSCVLLVLTGQLEIFHHGDYLSIAGGLMILTFLGALAVIGHRRRSLRQRFTAERIALPAGVQARPGP